MSAFRLQQPLRELHAKIEMADTVGADRNKPAMQRAFWEIVEALELLGIQTPWTGNPGPREAYERERAEAEAHQKRLSGR